MLYTRQKRNTIPCLSISLALMKPGISANFFSQEMERYFSFKSNHRNSAIQNNDQTLTFFPHFVLRAYIVHTFSSEGMQKRDIHDHKFLNIQACGISLTFWIWSHCQYDTNRQESLA